MGNNFSGNKGLDIDIISKRDIILGIFIEDNPRDNIELKSIKCWAEEHGYDPYCIDFTDKNYHGSMPEFNKLHKAAAPLNTKLVLISMPYFMRLNKQLYETVIEGKPLKPVLANIDNIYYLLNKNTSEHFEEIYKKRSGAADQCLESTMGKIAELHALIKEHNDKTIVNKYELIHKSGYQSPMDIIVDVQFCLLIEQSKAFRKCIEESKLLLNKTQQDYPLDLQLRHSLQKELKNKSTREFR